MVSVARASHLASFRSSTRGTKAKNLTLWLAGCPKGLSNPLETRTGISCGANPKYHAASSAIQKSLTLGIHASRPSSAPMCMRSVRHPSRGLRSRFNEGFVFSSLAWGALVVFNPPVERIKLLSANVVTTQLRLDEERDGRGQAISSNSSRKATRLVPWRLNCVRSQPLGIIPNSRFRTIRNSDAPFWSLP